jgi:hypothetical protein
MLRIGHQEGRATGWDQGVQAARGRIRKWKSHQVGVICPNVVHCCCVQHGSHHQGGLCSVHKIHSVGSRPS